MFRAGRAATEARMTGPLASPVPALLVVPLPVDSRSVPSGQLSLAGLPAPCQHQEGNGPLTFQNAPDHLSTPACSSRPLPDWGPPRRPE